VIKLFSTFSLRIQYFIRYLEELDRLTILFIPGKEGHVVIEDVKKQQI
jgi:hypothetical protein